MGQYVPPPRKLQESRPCSSVQDNTTVDSAPGLEEYTSISPVTSSSVRMTRPIYRRETTDTTTFEFVKAQKEDNVHMLDDTLSGCEFQTENSSTTLKTPWHSRWMAKFPYDRIPEDEHEHCDLRRKSKEEVLRNKKGGLRVVISWKTSTAILSLLSILQTVLLVVNRGQSCACVDFEMTRLSTGFPGLPRQAKVTTKRFGFALHAEPNGTLQAIFDPSKSVFVGRPSPEIDAAWEDLIGDRYFKLLPSEVESLNQDTALPEVSPLPVWKDAVPEAGPYGGLDMMHSLHCVNSLRKALSPDYYAGTEMLLLPGEDAHLHLDHCLEQLRQEALCHADTTVVTLKPVITDLEDGRTMLTMLGETERLHTCRDSKPIFEWVREQARTRGRLH